MKYIVKTEYFLHVSVHLIHIGMKHQSLTHLIHLYNLPEDLYCGFCSLIIFLLSPENKV